MNFTAAPASQFPHGEDVPAQGSGPRHSKPAASPGGGPPFSGMTAPDFCGMETLVTHRGNNGKLSANLFLQKEERMFSSERYLPRFAKGPQMLKEQVLVFAGQRLGISQRGLNVLSDPGGAASGLGLACGSGRV